MRRGTENTSSVLRRCVSPSPCGTMAVVGLLESLMTSKLVDDITDTHSRKTREAWGRGAANMLTMLFGGMGGCAMIGQTTNNVKASGARTRISTFLAGVFLLILAVSPTTWRRDRPDRVLHGHRGTVLCLKQQPHYPIRQCGRPRPHRDRHVDLPRLGRVDRRGTRRHQEQIRTPLQTRRVRLEASPSV